MTSTNKSDGHENYDKWSSQFRKGYIELCVLISLDKRASSYGFELLQIFEQAGLSINEGTLYPLLNRMQKNGLLDSEWQPPADGGHPRRFYSLSPEGKQVLPQMLETYQASHQTLLTLQEVS